MKKIILFLPVLIIHLSSWGQSIPDPGFETTRAPERFEAVFMTTRGDFQVEVIRKWSPEGADRLFHLLQTGFYNHNCLFRVQPEYVVQFGICDKPEVNLFWESRPIKDEPVVTSNTKGTIAYARDGAETRTTQLFINVNDNNKLDTVMFNGLRGFTPVGRIIKGYEVVEHFFSGYGFDPANHQDSAMVMGNAYWQENFPELDYIMEAVISNQ